MQRVIVQVDSEGAERWRVIIRLDGRDLVGPYYMNAVSLTDRVVPVLPFERAASAAGPHASLCRGEVSRLTALLDRIRSGNTRDDDVRMYGRWLFDCLLGPAWPVVLELPEVRRGRAVELALRWPQDETNLHRLVWEAMGDDRAPLAAHPAVVVAVTRIVPFAQQREIKTIQGIPTVLFATSVALTDPTIRPGAMYMGLLQELDRSGRCRARVAGGVSREQLQELCSRWRPDVVHLVAHGTVLPGGRGAVMLRDEEGIDSETEAEPLLAALSPGGLTPLVVVLSACNSASPGEGSDAIADAAPLAAQLVAGGIPIVSAMAGEVSESACRLYTRKLAEAVHAGRSPVEASAHGRRAALVGSEHRGSMIDWALPALYLADDVSPDISVVNTSTALRLTELSDNLALRHEPVFIGRTEILDAADRAVSSEGGIGAIAVTAEGPISRMGGTRLLQEIGWRLLRDGHVPVLLGPFQEAGTTPKTPAAVISAILGKIVKITEKMDLPPFAPAALLDNIDRIDEAALQLAVTQDSAPRARSALRKAVSALRVRDPGLDPEVMRDLLAEDFAQLAVMTTQWGQPFGDRTRVVLLCDNVHAWSAPEASASSATGLRFLLEMLDASGLGRPSRPAPVVLTASTTAAAGKAISDWARRRPGLLVQPLTELRPAERIVGYQWILLHPWRSRAIEDEEVFGRVYTATPGHQAEWESNLARVGGKATSIEDRLHFAADQAYGWKTVTRADDEECWRRYVDEHPEYRNLQ